jgi:hypothetical protein
VLNERSTGCSDEVWTAGNGSFSRTLAAKESTVIAQFVL